MGTRLQDRIQAATYYSVKDWDGPFRCINSYSYTHTFIVREDIIKSLKLNNPYIAISLLTRSNAFREELAQKALKDLNEGGSAQLRTSKSLEAYYQESGRCGRDGLPSVLH